MQTKISTIITSFNRIDTLKRAVESIRNQTFSDWQLIIADNSSNRKMQDAIRLYGEGLMAEDKRVLFVHYDPIENQNEIMCSYAHFINQAFELADGEYISYLCDDDEYKPNHFQTCLETFAKYPEASVVYAGVDMYNDNTKKVYYQLPSFLKKRCMFYSVDHGAIMHKRELFKLVGGWSESKYVKRFGDAEFFYRLGMAGFTAYPTKHSTEIKHVHDESFNLTGEVKYENPKDSSSAE